MVFWSFAQIFLFCEFGERLTGRFNEIDQQVNQCDWYTFPLQIQKLLPIFLKGTQNPIVLYGIGELKCTRETFKDVSNCFYLLWKKIRVNLNVF